MTTMLPIDTAKIRELREAAGLTLAEAASRARMKSHQQWWQVEAGKRPDPSVTTLQRMAHVLGVSMDDLMLPLDDDAEDWTSDDA
ncbi:MAG: helix-turn-helix transcriptional regulator [Planctomycetota bacterium]